MATEAPAAEVTEVSKSQIKITMGFWHSGLGIFVKRVFWNVVANAGTTLLTQLNTGIIDWKVVRAVAATQALYILISTAQTFKDTSIPNLPNEEVKILR